MEPQKKLPSAVKLEVGEDSDSGIDDVLPKSDEDDHTAAEQRRVQTSIFRSWVQTKAETITKDEVEQQITSMDDEALSIKNILSKQERSAIITDPRDYQIELYEMAKKENVIAVLDTGSGKTLIAVLLLRHVLDEELESRALNKSPRISFFLVDTVALAFQQYTVLETNLDHKIEKLYGDLGNESLQSRVKWRRWREDNMVIVCTADVLHQALMRSLIRMDQINLLIFDEAHHAKKSHPYARIILDGYLPLADAPRKPKIFGMTASPVDARGDLILAASELEKLLHSRIITVGDVAQLSRTICRPDEHIVQYEPLKPPFETHLHSKIDATLDKVPYFSPHLSHASEVSSHLGPWCVDDYWSLVFSESQVMRAERTISREQYKKGISTPMAEMESHLRLLREATDIVSTHEFLPPVPSLDQLSTKVLQLKELLSWHFERQSDTRCIIFVERRYFALLLRRLFQHESIGTAHLRPAILVGQGDGFEDETISVRQQVMTIAKFRSGTINCLFATSVAEEGLDIPDCNVVIRFDMYRTMIQYIQSRGRARHRNSKYYHMIEKHNSEQKERFIHVRHAESQMRNFCITMPQDRRLCDDSAEFGDSLSVEAGCRIYTEPITGARLTYGTSLSVLAHFSTALPRESNEPPVMPQYVLISEVGKFVCEVIMPENCPVRSAIGKVCKGKSLAKRSAAFEVCIKLREGKYLDENLLPIYTKHLPAMRNALLALDLKKSNMYEMRRKPEMWSKGQGETPSTIYITIIDLTEPLDRPHQRLGLLTRKRMPKLPMFPLHLNSGDVTWVTSQPLEQSLALPETDLEELTTFTLKIFKDLFNKTYEQDTAKMSYWLAPLLARTASSADPLQLIDWEAVHAVHEDKEVKWHSSMDNSELLDKFLVDPWHGGRRYFTTAIHPTYKATDPVPDDAVKERYMDTILNYSISLFKSSRAKHADVWDTEQPVLVATKALHRRNMLAQAEVKESQMRSRAYICPQPLKISPLAVGVATLGLVFPAIIHRIESYLIVLDACDLVGLRVRPALALEAFTKDSDNSEEHAEVSINFKHGMGNNYERLEFIGDCFLKMATSISLFAQNPGNDEFESHVKRMVLICNKNLFNTAIKMGLFEYIRSQAFSRRTWYPEGIKLLEGKGANKTGNDIAKHSLGDKTIADVCEALIGAAFFDYHDTSKWSPSNWDQAVRAVTALVSNPDHTMTCYSDYYAVYKTPANQLEAASASQLDLAAKVEQQHAYHFQYPRLLRTAFIHPSHPYSWENLPSYQRLEFLGDSLLDMACVSYLFYRYPDKDPQWLTEHKMAMVSNRFLGAVCIKLGFHRHIRYGASAQLERSIRTYVAEIQQAEREATVTTVSTLEESGEEISTTTTAPDYWTTVESVPKCLPDVVESFIGALFVDSAFDYGQVQRFFDAHIAPFFTDMSIYDDYANNHPTTHLTHVLTNHMGCANHRILAAELCSVVAATGGGASSSGDVGAGATGPSRCIAAVMVHRQIVAEGRANSGKNAKVKASLAALEVVVGMAPREFRIRFGCDCEVSATSTTDTTTSGKRESEGNA